MSACASGPVKTRIEYVRPPAGYFAPCAVPQPENGQLGYLALEYTLMLQEALAECNDQNRAGREWLESAQ